ncbi:hypothetical protein EMIHUDRAFT_196632, partial [Emiliania huxleyi CCMP1516]|uniref:PHD-type domain-containing protein n=2 Tax=Emiliania huxleyi TaxID=2903 RepID=A0A0D3J4G3_EMIH1
MEEAGSTAPEPEAAARVQAAEPADAEQAAALSAADADDVPVGAPVCVFCARGAHPVCGRLIPVSPGCWAHVNCAMWSSE